MNDKTIRDALYHFPCTLDIKIIARRKKAIDEDIKTLVQDAGFKLDNKGHKITPSKSNQYWSITLPIKLDNQAALDKLHQVLNTHDDVIMTL